MCSLTPPYAGGICPLHGLSHSLPCPGTSRNVARLSTSQTPYLVSVEPELAPLHRLELLVELYYCSLARHVNERESSVALLLVALMSSLISYLVKQQPQVVVGEHLLCVLNLLRRFEASLLEQFFHALLRDLARDVLHHDGGVLALSVSNLPMSSGLPSRFVFRTRLP